MKSFVYISFVALIAPFFFCFALLIKLFTFWFDRKGVVLHFFTRFWALIYLYFFPNLQSIQIYGKENIQKGKTYLIISNHLSSMDILIGYYLPVAFKWVSKKEMVKVPFIGWNMVLNRYVLLDRNSKSSIKNMMKSCVDYLNKEISVFLFPEGTRSKDGQLGQFKSGAFLIAKQVSCDILPVVIRGTNQLLPKHTLFPLGKNEVSVTILPPVASEEIQSYSAKELMKRMQGLYEKELGNQSDE